MPTRTPNEIIENMTNVGGSGQDTFVGDWADFARGLLYGSGISRKYINSDDGTRLVAKIVTDMIEDGSLSKTSEMRIASERVNHPHSEDEEA